MIDDLRALAIFAETVRLKSFRQAGTSLGLSASVVSYHISQLEQRIGSTLIYRSTRRLSLTHDGEQLYRHAQVMLDAAREGLAEVTARRQEPAGQLKLTLPSFLARAPVTIRLARFARQFPAVALEIHYTDVRRDLIADGIDLAIRAGELPDNNLRARKIADIERRLVCSAQYLQTRAVPQVPEDLNDWDWIRLHMLSAKRTLVHPDGTAVELQYSGRLVVDSVDAMTQFCLQSAGLCTPPAFMIADALSTKALVEVMLPWQVQPISLYAVWPGNERMNHNVRCLIDFLIDGE